MMPSTRDNASSTIAGFGRTVTAFGAVVAVAGAVTIAPPSDPPQQRTMPAVTLTATYLPLAAQQRFQELLVRAAVPKPEPNHVAVAPRTSRHALPSPPAPQPVVTASEFEDAIINTYHAIEPWVRYGFELGTYVVGWVPWVGWLAPQIMIFYNFGERIVESLVVNSANWLWGPLPFGEGLANVARDSWNALVQLGRDEWNFWLPPLPPLPFTAEQAAGAAQDDVVGTADEPAAPSAGRPHPVRDAILALARRFPALDPNAPHNVERPRWVDRTVRDLPVADPVTVSTADDAKDQGAPVDSEDNSMTPTEGDRSAQDPTEPDDTSPGNAHPSDPSDQSPQSGSDAESAAGDSRAAPSEDSASSTASRTRRGARDTDRRGPGIDTNSALPPAHRADVGVRRRVKDALAQPVSAAARRPRRRAPPNAGHPARSAISSMRTSS